ncbi:hypothetical protein L9F63_002207, partial [Diploptera punctata]
TFPESPRWLATKGKTRQCLQVLNQIARVNGTVVPENAMEVLQNLKGNREKGSAIDVRYPYGILGSLCILGTICSLLMPETLNQKLPETLQDSAHFGKNQEFWNFPWKSRNQKYVPTAR